MLALTFFKGIVDVLKHDRKGRGVLQAVQPSTFFNRATQQTNLPDGSQLSPAPLQEHSSGSSKAR